MSDVKWCDLGGHPFPANQMGATTIALRKQVKNQWGGNQPQDIVQDVCAACAVENGLSELKGQELSEAENIAMARRVRGETTGGRFHGHDRAAITSSSVHDPAEARAKGYDPDYVAWLEKQAEKTEVDDTDLKWSVDER